MIRRLGEQIAALLLLVLDPALQQLDDARALGQQDGQALADDVDGGEIFELAAELVVVALQSLLLLGEIGVQLVLLREGDAVDALKRLRLAVAAPVGALQAVSLMPLPLMRPVESRCGPAQRSVKSPCL
jgi:hypothetical protein